jgi:hypothetical protein
MQRSQGKNGARPLAERTANAPHSRRGEGKREVAPVRTHAPPSSTRLDNKRPSTRAAETGDVAKPALAARSHALRKAHLSSGPATPSLSTDKATGDGFLPTPNFSGSEDDGWTVGSKNRNRNKRNGSKNKGKGKGKGKRTQLACVDRTPATQEPCMTRESTNNIRKNLDTSGSACDSKREPRPLPAAASSLDEMEARIFGIPVELWHMNWEDQEQDEVPRKETATVTEPTSQPMEQEPQPLPAAASSLDEMEARIFGIPVELWHVKWEDKEQTEIHTRDTWIAGKRMEGAQQKQQPQCSLAKMLQDAQVRFDQAHTCAVLEECEPREISDDQEDTFQDEDPWFSSDFSGKNPFLLLEVDC